MAVEPHKHCPVCGTPIPMDEKVCSQDCEVIIAQKQKQVKRNQMIMYLLLIVFIAIWLYITFLK